MLNKIKIFILNLLGFYSKTTDEPEQLLNLFYDENTKDIIIPDEWLEDSDSLFKFHWYENLNDL